jgi:hypothetical protein
MAGVTMYQKHQVNNHVKYSKRVEGKNYGKYAKWE